MAEIRSTRSSAIFEAVVVAGIERFALTSATAVTTYATRHPDRVSHPIFRRRARRQSLPSQSEMLLELADRD
jgi:hypothetical protein